MLNLGLLQASAKASFFGHILRNNISNKPEGLMAGVTEVEEYGDVDVSATLLLVVVSRLT